MKGSERHRLKENEVALSVARLTETLEQRQHQIIWGAVAAVAVIGAAVAIWYWRANVDNTARRMLGDAMVVAEAPVVPPTPPSADAKTPAPSLPAGSYPSERARLEAALASFSKVADAYPSSVPGLTARFEAAATLAALGRSKEAISQYQQVIDRAGKGLLAETARVGLASAQVQAGQYDQAIAAFKQMAALKDGPLPTDGVLMELAKAHTAAGQRAEALKIYQRIVDEYPQSIYAGNARREIDLARSDAAS